MPVGHTLRYRIAYYHVVSAMSSLDTIYYDRIDSPIGSLCLVADAHGLREVRFAVERRPSALPTEWIESRKQLSTARQQVTEYLTGRRRVFDLPLNFQGTPFQLAVWAQLCAIPFGTTTSYGELARRMGKPTAFHAVGAAIGRNPMPVIAPCHRVIGTNGKLTGYAGGLPIKEFLLNLERPPVVDHTPG